MNLREAFKHQIETTRLLEEVDFKDVQNPLFWNGVIFRLGDENVYSSNKQMTAGDKFLIGYVIRETETPKPILLEESELSFYEDKLFVVRVVRGDYTDINGNNIETHIPVLQEFNYEQKADQGEL